MATDYDAPRNNDEDKEAESLEALQANRGGSTQSSSVDVEDADTAEGIDLPGADLSGEELLIQVIPPQDDEFTCASCFLVRHRSQIASERDGQQFCSDCVG